MTAIIDFMHTLGSYMSVDLRGSEIGVSEQHLNRTQIGVLI